MAALLLKRLTLQTIKTENTCIRRRLGKYVVQKTALAEPSHIASAPRPSCLIHAEAFSTEDTQDKREKKKKNETAFRNVGRKINERIIQVLDEKGNDLGPMHRANVIDLRPLDFPEPWLSSSVKWSTSASKLRLTQGPTDTERLWGHTSSYSRPQPLRAPRTVVGGTEGGAPPVPPPLAFISLQG